MTIYITGDFDGGNPKSPEMIKKTAHSSFIIMPYSEDDDPNYKFKLDVKIINKSSSIRNISLTIDWQDQQFNHLRDHIYILHENDFDWKCLPMNITETLAIGQIKINPGETYICLQPKYNYSDYIKFLNKIPETKLINKQIIGKTREKRDLWLIKLASQKKAPAKRIMLVARIHPYETAGSFCVEGIVNYIINQQSNEKSLNADIYILPMANPDGVFGGLCKLTSRDGIDLSRNVDLNNPVSSTIKKCIDDIKPHVYCEFHNWMLHDFDGICYLNWFQAKRFINNISIKKKFKKQWKAIFHKRFFQIPHHGFKKYCRDSFSSTSICLEYPWKHRNLNDMEEMGSKTLKALINLC